MQKQRKQTPRKPQQDTHVAPKPTITDESPPIDGLQRKRNSLPDDLQTPPMRHATKAWCKAAIKRQLDNGVFELDRIIRNTGISAETATEIYIEIT